MPFKPKIRLPVNVGVHVEEVGTYYNYEYVNGILKLCKLYSVTAEQNGQDAEPKHFKLSKVNLTKLITNKKLIQYEFIPIDVQADVFITDSATDLFYVNKNNSSLRNISAPEEDPEPELESIEFPYPKNTILTPYQVSKMINLKVGTINGHIRKYTYDWRERNNIPHPDKTQIPVSPIGLKVKNPDATQYFKVEHKVVYETYINTRSLLSIEETNEAILLEEKETKPKKTRSIKT